MYQVALFLADHPAASTGGSLWRLSAASGATSLSLHAGRTGAQRASDDAQYARTPSGEAQQWVGLADEGDVDLVIVGTHGRAGVLNLPKGCPLPAPAPLSQPGPAGRIGGCHQRQRRC